MDMKRFEYKTMVVSAKGWWGGKIDAAEFDLMLNAMGRDGWELVDATASNQNQGSTRYVICIFKREMI